VWAESSQGAVWGGIGASCTDSPQLDLKEALIALRSGYTESVIGVSPRWATHESERPRASAGRFSLSPRSLRSPPRPPRTAVRESKVTVKIPRPLYRKIQQVVDGSGFNSPTDFIVYVLRDLMGEADASHQAEFNQDELDDVKRKLKNLGYL